MPKILLKCLIIQQLLVINTRCNHNKKYDCYLKDYFLCQLLYLRIKNSIVKVHLLIYIIVLYFEYFAFLHDYFRGAHLEIMQILGPLM